MRTLFKILGVTPRRRRPKTITAVRVTLFFGDGRPDLHMVLTEGGWEILKNSLMFGGPVAMTHTIEGEIIHVDISNYIAHKSQFVQVLER